MDKEFMRSYYRTFYEHAYNVAVADSEEYREKQHIRQTLEYELEKMMGGINTPLYKKFDEYVGVYADEMDVMLEEVSLLGAADREKMLRQPP